jgi:hypothetical protein
MASAALKADAGTEIPGEEHVEDGQRDFEAEAREHGWSPKEEFKGDSNRWIDAETFMKRADEMMPLLKADKARLKRELDAIKKDLKRATVHFEGAEERAYKRAYADIEKRVADATEAGDVDAAKAALKDLGELKPSAAGPLAGKTEAELESEAAEAFDDFREEHPWFDHGSLASATDLEREARIFFQRMVDKNLGKTKEMLPADFFQMVTDMTVEKYPALKGKASRQKPASAVEGGNSGRPRGSSKTWDNLPDEAKRQFDRFINRGLLGVKPTGDKDKDTTASRAYYARSFDWEGYKA